jgi:hypothetical protein
MAAGEGTPGAAPPPGPTINDGAAKAIVSAAIAKMRAFFNMVAV